MEFTDKLKKKLKPLYREEQTTFLGLLALRLLTEINCLLYQARHYKLKKETRRKRSDLRSKRAKNVFVFANGPSVSDLDLTKVKKLRDSGEFDLITVNSFASNAISKFEILPTVSVFADPVYYRSCDDPLFSQSFQKDIDAMNEHGVPAMVPYRYYKMSRFNESIPYSGVRNVFRKNVSDVTKPFGFFNLTAFHALSLAIDLEYENIYICGYDNSYFKSYEVDEDGEQYFADKHFYDKGVQTRRHLPAEDYGPTSRIFYDTYRHFKYLEKISKHGKKNVKIYNVAKTTYTCAFPRRFDLDIYV